MDDAQAQQTNPLFGIIPKNFSHRWHRRTDLYIGTVCAGCFRQ